MIFQIKLEDSHYLESSARLRNMSRKMLLERVLEVAVRDQMFLAILDDADKVIRPFKRIRVPGVLHAP